MAISRFRAWFRERVREVFRDVDVVLAPATPWPAPTISQTLSVFDGAEVSTRQMLGIFTQPLSFIGLPIVSVPVMRPGALPCASLRPWRHRASSEARCP